MQRRETETVEMTTRGDAAHRLIGIGLMVGAFAFFAVLDATAKHLMPSLGMPFVVFCRYAFAAFFVSLWVWQQGGVSLLRTRHWALQVVRGILLVASTALNFLALNYIQIGISSWM
jgi:drug/metabolite transporter (DMT)-like permease